MNTYSSNSPNPYAKRYLTKGRRSLDNNAYLDVWPTNKKIKKEIATPLHIDHHASSHTNRDITQKSETYNFLTEDNFIQTDYHELYDNSIEFDRINEASVENCIYLNENEHQNVADENSVFINNNSNSNSNNHNNNNNNNNNEEYSIDFIDDTESAIIDSFSYNGQYQHEQQLYNNCFIESQFVPQQQQLLQQQQQPMKNKRKQGIVGRPTLSSPQRLLVPDNVYSRGNPCTTDNENYFTDNNYRNRLQPAVICQKNLNFPVKKSTIKHESLEHEENLQRNANRSRPRILSKPSLPDYRQFANSHIYFNATEQDALEIAQRTVANREFARNLVKRAERQGTVIDKNKIPLSVFEQQPVEVLMKSAFEEQRAGIAEIKESEQAAVQPPFSGSGSSATVISVADARKIGSIKKQQQHQPQQNGGEIAAKAAPMTASDILKQKWKAANRQQS